MTIRTQRMLWRRDDKAIVGHNCIWNRAHSLILPMRNLCFSRSIAFKYLVVGFNILVEDLERYYAKRNAILGRLKRACAK